MTTLALAAILILSSFTLGALATWWWIGWRVAAAGEESDKKVEGFRLIARELVLDADQRTAAAKAITDDPRNHPDARELALVIDWVRVDHQSRSAVVTSGTNAQTWEVTLKHHTVGRVDLSAKGQGGLSEAVGQAMDAMKKGAN
jgi:hypothetical protein